MSVRIFRTILVLGLAATFLACDGPRDIVAPGDRLEAKGGAKGPPGQGDDGSGGEPSLVEYYVVPSADGSAPNLIHMVVTGSQAVSLAGQVVQDYFFNGIRDLTNGPHYEYYVTPALQPLLVEELDGVVHIDTEWQGEWLGSVPHPFPDVPTAAVPVDGGTADPFAFRVGVLNQGGNVLGAWTPEGVVLNGSVVGKTASGTYGHTGTVTSYALHSGPTATGVIWVQELTATGTCSEQTIREGKGKNRTTRTVTQVPVNLVGEVRSDPLKTGPSGFWSEFHLRVPGSTEVSEGQSINDGVNEPFDRYVTFTLEEPLSGQVDLELVMDYMLMGWSSYDGEPHVYDPTRNSGSLDTRYTGPTTTVDDGLWPEIVIPVTVTCN